MTGGSPKGAVDSPRPSEPDLHLSICLRGIRFDYCACRTAAILFLREHLRERYIDQVTVEHGSTNGLPRLPTERLYLPVSADLGRSLPT